MQEEAEKLFVQIIRDSQKKNESLRLMANFFNNVHLINILIRTKIIHNLFENNRTLDINKLELFHIQYTNSLMDLMLKIKRSKEQKYLSTTDEIHIKEDFIQRLLLEVNKIQFADLIRGHAEKMSMKLAALYRMLETSQETAFSWDEIFNFSNSIQAEYYRPITIEQYEQLTMHQQSVYSNRYVKIEKKLMGRLNVLKFKIKFLCGFTCNNTILEVFEFRDSNDKFIYINSEKALYLINPINYDGIDFNKNSSTKQQIIDQLKMDVSGLKQYLGSIKSSLSEEVQMVLKNYLEKISSVDFLDELQNVDEQTNILKAMLNVNINS